ncbi:hypothetical protein GCM10023335_66960 [Streptomyces siamensis]|uniref:Uncharacterized protein n=2 Tax=Streptomyces siamensis TaxID=1274986 RepID=A0ABP9JFX5_9ACTN
MESEGGTTQTVYILYRYLQRYRESCMGKALNVMAAPCPGRHQPTNHLMRSPGALLDQIDEATRPRFQMLFRRPNAFR